ncbi:MAG: ABC transporter ATP-binding protein/permease [Gammaproteobacteria bacterium]|nr:ABC transporter ATP-binding protein/permease [Gammaproteobacteria bacterium]
MIFVMAFLEIVGIASIMPFMAMLASPDVVHSNRFLNLAYTSLGFTDQKSFLLFLGALVFVALVISISCKAATNWAIAYFSTMRNYSLAKRLVGGYLAQPYEWFLNRHSAELGKAVLSEVQVVVDQALMPMMRMIANGTVIVAILFFLVAVDPLLAFIVGGVMGGMYGIIYLTFRRLLVRIGQNRLAANEARFTVVGEAFGGIKEVKVGGLESRWLKRFDSAAHRFARTQFVARVVGLIPRFVLEIVAFGGMLILLLFLMYRGEGLEAVLPIMAVYALAGYRLLPALQKFYSDLTIFKFTGPALYKICLDFGELRPDLAEDLSLDQSSAMFHTHGTLQHAITMNHVTYTYPNAQRPALHDFSIRIPARTTVGFVGKTGSGKTTAVDIFLGLLQPESGSLVVDDLEVTTDNRRAWRRSVGYVPQSIFLTDDSIAGNIAFGVPKKEIDSNAVERAARIANLHEFVVNELPEGYNTSVGERGVRLSGGQRQRIGIARALYHKPRVIVLDEATSALDSLTEQAVMDAVHNLGGTTTVLLIAHRLSTVRECDYIYILENGQLIGEGTFEDLNSTHSRFRALAGQGTPNT